MTNQIIGLIGGGGAGKCCPALAPRSEHEQTVWRRYHRNHMPALFLPWLVVMWPEPKHSFKLRLQRGAENQEPGSPPRKASVNNPQQQDHEYSLSATSRCRTTGALTSSKCAVTHGEMTSPSVLWKVPPCSGGDLRAASQHSAPSREAEQPHRHVPSHPPASVCVNTYMCVCVCSHQAVPESATGAAD